MHQAMNFEMCYISMIKRHKSDVKSQGSISSLCSTLSPATSGLVINSSQNRPWFIIFSALFISLFLETLARHWWKVTEMTETAYFHLRSVFFSTQQSKASTIVKVKLKGPTNTSTMSSALPSGEFCELHSLSVVLCGSSGWIRMNTEPTTCRCRTLVPQNVNLLRKIF